jgi:hypothetical protein
MTTPIAPVREHAPRTIRLAAAARLRSALGLLMAIGMFAAGFTPPATKWANGCSK